MRKGWREEGRKGKLMGKENRKEEKKKRSWGCIGSRAKLGRFLMLIMMKCPNTHTLLGFKICDIDLRRTNTGV